MASLCVSPTVQSFACYSYYNSNKNKLLVINNNTQKQRCFFFNHSKLFSRVPRDLSFISFNSLLRYSIRSNEVTVQRKAKGFGVVCYSGPLNTSSLQWISTISSVILTFVGGTGIRKSFLVPLFALQAPASVVSWIKSEYGIWTAFVALLVRLFLFIPGELELPFVALLLVILAPCQVLSLRGTQQGAIIALAMAGYLAFQHFSRIGNLQRAFDQGSIIATLAIISLTVISCLFLI